ncbi:hypothetical protein BDR26DRAFT_625333 [Obelidium mucronatum]|nr:hypothetical protein BDR26DRAFT_625333 [Obelidium mucronatum]
MQILCFLAAFASIASIANATCPIKEKCPYAKYTPSTHGSSDGCPLKTAGCPYYETHAKDKTLADFVTEADGKCPLSEKCPLYKFIRMSKRGKRLIFLVMLVRSKINAHTTKPLNLTGILSIAPWKSLALTSRRISKVVNIHFTVRVKILTIQKTAHT